MKRHIVGLIVGFLAAAPSWAASGEAILQERCAQCHDLTGPAPTTLEGLWARKGPDLFYAGVKYKPEWMERWLQNPTRIRPAGMFYGNHVRTGPDGQDVIDTASLVEHPRLSAAEAKAVTRALMAKKDALAPVEKGAYQPGRISLRMGELMFDKFKGCLACHQIEPDYGGLSGPEVYTVTERLQEDFLVAYLRDPHAFDPKIFMPNKKLKERDIQKFIHYFRALAKEVKP